MACLPRLLAQTFTSQYNLRIPTFLCPLSNFYTPLKSGRKSRMCSLGFQRQSLQLPTPSRSHEILPLTSQLLALPRSCPGCGAFTQTTDSNNAGFYSIKRRSVNAFVAQHVFSLREQKSEESNHNVDDAKTDLRSDGNLDFLKDSSPVAPTPICNRCHGLLHHHSGAPIVHPKIQSIHEIISESPYKYNHIYHVLDAADFPLSLIPQLQRYLSLTPQRSRNRRAKNSRFYHGRRADLSFIITRSDLLAPKKVQVDALMPYLLEVLRDALGSYARDLRLGNVRLVSSKRGWWTRNLKEDIWNRGGGGWMVGKVNVGKSNLYDCVYPKGRIGNMKFISSRRAAGKSEFDSVATANRPLNSEPSSNLEDEYLQEDALLPPAPVESPFPVMPLVSSMPGTTASPIRHLFGGGRGELVDLPGLRRGDLEKYVADDHKLDLVMQHRLKPEQFVLKPGQSLLLGCLIRITTRTPDVTVLAYPFVPFPVHITSTEKAIEIHTQQRLSGIPTIAKPGVGESMSSAGTFRLKWDVTKKRAGPLTSPAAVGLNPKVLPFKVLSTDILIEGCGWVELVAQVRKREAESLENLDEGSDGEDAFPAVEVFSPEGNHIGARRPMSAWLLGGRKPIPPSARTVRPRRSMKGVKKSLKIERRRQAQKTV